MGLMLRVYGLQRQKQRMQPDDLLLIASHIILVVLGVSMVVGAQKNFIGGHTTPPATSSRLELLGKYQYAFWIIHSLDIGLIKLALLVFFRRVFKGRGKRTPFDIVNWTLIITTVLWTLIAVFISIFECGIHAEGTWTGLEQLKRMCLNNFLMYAALAVASSIVDLAILIEPLIMIRRLNMSTRRKIQVSLVFLLSGFAVIAVQRGSDNEEKGIISVLEFWAYVELGVGFMVACLPPCAQFIDKLSPTPLYNKLRSIPSLASISWRNGRSRRSFEQHPLPDNSSPFKSQEGESSLSIKSSREAVFNKSNCASNV
ncbi:hypothetical protein LA080_000791 [Diaporthe eres]|nr:hypothetical protein LA080_000791 [Diaporthe eres]